MPTSMPPTGPSLTWLPNEILTMICANLSAKDLAAIRLTCKETNPVATTRFATRYFKDPFVMMSKESLEALVEICKHPVFGPQVRKVQLLSARPSRYSRQPLDRNLTGTVEGEHVAMVERSRSRDALLVELTTKQLEFEVSSDSHRLMEEAFMALERYQKPVVVSVQRLSKPYLPIGLAKAFKHLTEQRHDILVDQHVVSTLDFMLTAASCTECVIRRIEIGLDPLNHRGRYLLRKLSEEFRQEHASLLMRLKEFHLDFSCQLSRGMSYTVVQTLKSVMQVIPRSIENLTLSSDFDPYRFDNLLSYQINAFGWYNELKEVSLHKVLLGEEQLIGLLRANQASLKRLSLVKLIIIGDWDQILSWISKGLALDQFTLGLCYKGQDHVPVQRRFLGPAEQWYFESCELRGKQDICRGLDLFIKVQAEERQARRTALLGHD